MRLLQVSLGLLGLGLLSTVSAVEVVPFETLKTTIGQISERLTTISRLDKNKAADIQTIYENGAAITDQLESVERQLLEKPIYKDDDRVNYYQTTDARRSAAQAVAVMVRNQDLLEASDKSYVLPDRRLDLCKGERFRTEPAPGQCSAFRIAPNVIATAGHCIRDQLDCDSHSFVFSFRFGAINDRPHENISRDRVYRCKSLRKHRLDPATGADWAAVEVDRIIDGAIPTVILSELDDMPIGKNVTVIGHPSGLPVKIAANGIVRTSKSFFFVASTDTFGGNSGSPVFLTDELDDGELIVAGILVRGEDDYDIANGCRKAKICAANGCSGEDITFAKYLHKD